MTPLPARLVVRECGIALDGGSVYLGCADEAGRPVAVKLVQHAFPAAGQPHPSEVPGRMYLDGALVPLRSETEARLLDLLRAAKVPAGGDSVAGELVTRVVRFVESDRYLRFADRVEMAADPTRYDVWVDWDEATRNRVTVKLASALGVGLKDARAFLAEGRPLEVGLTALRVVDRVAPYRADGLPVRVVPAFRWALP